MSEGKAVHVRRCHVCGGVTERVDDRVGQCDHCGKILAPYYFFEEDNVQVYSDVERRPDGERNEEFAEILRRELNANAASADATGSTGASEATAHNGGQRRPLRGFSAIW